MKLFLQVEIGHSRESNDDRLLLHFASSLSSDLIGTDIDNHADSFVIDLVIKLIEQVDKVFLMVVANEPHVPLGNALKVFTSLLDHSAVTVALLGNHELAEKILREFEQNLTRVNKEEEIKSLIAEFAQ